MADPDTNIQQYDTISIRVTPRQMAAIALLAEILQEQEKRPTTRYESKERAAQQALDAGLAKLIHDDCHVRGALTPPLGIRGGSRIAMGPLGLGPHGPMLPDDGIDMVPPIR